MIRSLGERRHRHCMRGGFLGIASVHLTLQCELPALPGHEDKAGFDPLGCGHPGKCTKKSALFARGMSCTGSMCTVGCCHVLSS